MIPILDQSEDETSCPEVDVKYWQVAASQKTGAGHSSVEGEFCEDVYIVNEPAPGVLVIGVADGAGSAAFARVGAQTAVESATAEISAAVEQLTVDKLGDGTVERILNDALQNALSAVQSEAAAREVDFRQFASTLLLVVAREEFIAAAQIGDGAVVVEGLANNVFCLTAPPKTEYINETVFLTSQEALQTAQVRTWVGRASGVAMFSDGLQMVCLKWPECLPHRAFFTPLFDFVRDTNDEEVSAIELTRFLHSERLGKQTDDDITLVIAAAKSHGI